LRSKIVRSKSVIRKLPEYAGSEEESIFFLVSSLETRGSIEEQTYATFDLIELSGFLPKKALIGNWKFEPGCQLRTGQIRP
jgi:hypothetical protein